MDKLMACGLAEQIDRNKYVLSQDGKITKTIGVKKWANSLNDKNRKTLVYQVFELHSNWYSFPKLKIRFERITNTKISKETWFIIRGIVILLIAYGIWEMFGDSIVNYIKNMG